MLAKRHTEWLMLTVLVGLNLVPAIAGSLRLVDLAGGELTEHNARFMEQPVPVFVHILASLVFGFLGAFQFSGTLQSRHRRWHRQAGRVVIASGLLSACSALWMTLTYPIYHGLDGYALYVIRLVVSSVALAALALGVAAILKRRILLHKAWMMRAYALGLGAGTQVFTHLPMAFFPSLETELVRTICMGAGWLLNLLVAEYLLRKHRMGLFMLVPGPWQKTGRQATASGT